MFPVILRSMSKQMLQEKGAIGKGKSRYAQYLLEGSNLEEELCS